MGIVDKILGASNPENAFAKLSTPAVVAAITALESTRANLAKQEAVEQTLRESRDRLAEAVAQLKAELRPLGRSGHPIPDPERVARLAVGEDCSDLDRRDAERRHALASRQEDARIAGGLLRAHTRRATCPEGAQDGALVQARKAVEAATTALVSALRSAASSAQMPMMLVAVDGRSEQMGRAREVDLDALCESLRGSE